jgi:hypothetical protein
MIYYVIMVMDDTFVELLALLQFECAFYDTGCPDVGLAVGRNVLRNMQPIPDGPMAVYSKRTVT